MFSMESFFFNLVCNIPKTDRYFIFQPQCLLLVLLLRSLFYFHTLSNVPCYLKICVCLYRCFALVKYLSSAIYTVDCVSFRYLHSLYVSLFL